MADTTTETTKEVATTTSPPEVYHRPPPSYGFVNPMVFNAQNQPPTAEYKFGQLSGPPTRFQPSMAYPPPRTMVGGLAVIPPQTADINDYMSWSIFNICCCGLVLGIIAMLISSQVRERKMAGDVEGAKRLSIWAAVWNGFASLAGIGIIIVIIVYAKDLHYSY